MRIGLPRSRSRLPLSVDLVPTSKLLHAVVLDSAGITTRRPGMVNVPQFAVMTAGGRRRRWS